MHIVRPQWVNSLRPRRNRRHLADDIFKCIFLNENVWISITVSLKFVPKGPINNIPALVQIMAWRRPGDKPLSGTMMVRSQTHICVTRPQCVISLAPGRFEINFRKVIFQLILVIDGWSISCKIVLKWIPMDLTDGKSTGSYLRTQNGGGTSQNSSLIQVTQDGTAEDKPGHGHIKVCTVNTQSIRNKTGDVVEHVLSNKIDICAVTETWLKPADDAIRQECQPVGYSFTDYPRQSGRVGGGTGLLCRSNLTPSMVRSGEKKSFEFSEWLIKCPSLAIWLIVVYRPT